MSKWIATLLGVGYIKPAPGTWGSLAALPMFWALHQLGGWPFALVATIAVVFVGVWAIRRETDGKDNHDPSEIVIDEVAGQWIPLVIIPLEVEWYVAAFLLFRFFDISKIGPVGHAENFTGGIGVMADDLVAVILAAVVLWVGAISMGYAL